MLNALSLKPYNTFALNITAQHIVIADDVEQLLSTYQQAQQQNQPFLLIGEGSNLLFLDDFAGTVLINRLMGRQITADEDCWYLHIGAGENWHQLVQYTVAQGMAGLENLALIPGCVGSAPIQNIGAYGVELKDVCQYVDVVNLQTGDIERLTNQQCQFGYRDSIFKHQYQHHYAIVAVGLRLSKNWQPQLAYGELTTLDRHSVTAQQIFTIICQTRRQKLPDPQIFGNAGSFFKNPIVTETQAKQLLQRFPRMPVYWQADRQAKLAAGWLIDQCHLKGYRIGGAAVHQQQALVLINADNASAADIVALAKHVRQQVFMQFAVELQAEVRVIGPQGEVDSQQVFA